ncbi:MAG: 50S ribosomal protein L25 [Firmicutes bacterium]|nr:50S ribosomal protein L25 [Bacillota bacterium]
MTNYQLTVEERTQTGKGYNKKLRAEGKIPAVVYGFGQEAATLQADWRDVERMLSGPVNLVDLNLGTGKKTAIVKDVHRDPVKGTLLHVDFYEVDLTKKLEVTVPIRIVGEDQRPSDGGVVETHLWELTVLCLPTDIPNAIEVDVSGLELDQGLTVGELQLPAGVEALSDADELVTKVVLPRRPEAEEAEAEAEAAEGEAPEASAEAAEDGGTEG